MKIAPALHECSSIDQVVELINGDPACDAAAEWLAAGYAYQACNESDYKMDRDGLASNLDYLIEMGATFNIEGAWELLELEAL